MSRDDIPSRDYSLTVWEGSITVRLTSCGDWFWFGSFVKLKLSTDLLVWLKPIHVNGGQSYSDTSPCKVSTIFCTYRETQVLAPILLKWAILRTDFESKKIELNSQLRSSCDLPHFNYCDYVRCLLRFLLP